MLTLEKDIEAYLKRQVESHGGLCLKFPATYVEGITDRIVILPEGRVYFVELKRPKGGVLSEIQKYWQSRLKALGCRVMVIKNKAEVDALIEEVTQ